MALSFNQAKGEAQKNKIDSYQYVEGDNIVRMVGDILPRYVYWLKGENGVHRLVRIEKTYRSSVYRSIETLKHLTTSKRIGLENITQSLNAAGVMQYSVYTTEK